MKLKTNLIMILGIIVSISINAIMLYMAFINIRYSNSLTVGISINFNNFYYPLTGNGINIPIIILTVLSTIGTILLLKKYLKIMNEKTKDIIILNIKNNALAFLPFILFLFFYISVFEYSNHLLMISTLFLTFVIGLGLISKILIMKIMGIICSFILLLIFSINGYYDYIQWTSTIIGIIVFVYYLIIYVTIYKNK